MSTITFHPRGELPAPGTLQPGDIGLVSDPHRPDALSQLIQAGNRAIVGKNNPLANLIHSFGVTSAAGDIIEANAPGIQRNHLEGYRHQDFYIIHVDQFDATPEQLALCVARWESCVGMSYDKVGFVGVAFQCLFDGDHLLVSDEHGLICSAFVCYGALAWRTSWSRPYQAMMPVRIALELGFPIPEAPVALGVFARFLNGVATIGRALSTTAKAVLGLL